jgi:hypothetical protein
VAVEAVQFDHSFGDGAIRVYDFFMSIIIVEIIGDLSKGEWYFGDLVLLLLLILLEVGLGQDRIRKVDVAETVFGVGFDDASASVVFDLAVVGDGLCVSGKYILSTPRSPRVPFWALSPRGRSCAAGSSREPTFKFQNNNKSNL